MFIAKKPVVLSLGFAFVPLADAGACSSCGCLLTSNWESQGLVQEPGFRVEFRYDYLNQTELRTGNGIVNRQAVGLPTNREIEQLTTNHYFTATLDYAPNANWGFNVQLPFVSRYHETFAAGDTDKSYSQGDGLGDIRLLARYQGFPIEQHVGVMLGVKLPTGDFHQTFYAGPQAGNPLDRGLQLGTGTTDALMGLYHFGNLGKGFGYFVQGLAQVPLNMREDYQPGVSFSANTGVHYTGWEWITPHLQFNLKTGYADNGAQADVANSGGTIVYASPGVTFNLPNQAQLFTFVQVPVFQALNGYQLAPTLVVSTGIRFTF